MKGGNNMEKLAMSQVVFNSEHHTYELFGNKLKGVTPIVKWMFPDTYLGIPDEVLAKAADYGHLIHSKLELYDSVGIKDEECMPLMDYIALKEKYNIKVYLSEYMVDDGQNIASSIDKVFEPDEDGTWPLADVKTTSSIHVNNVRLQLSIYACLFELCNPGKKAGKIYVIWLPKPQYGKADVMELEKVPSETCKEIVAAYLAGEDSSRFQDLWDISKVKQEGTEEDLPEKYLEVETELVDILQKEKELADRKAELKEYLMSEMSASGVRKWTSENLTITKKAGGVKQAVDSKKLKAEYNDVYLACVKTSSFKETIEIKQKV